MKNNEKFWKTTEIVLGAIGAALLVLILVLRLTGREAAVLTYALIGIVILFLISDEFARAIRRRQEKEKAALEQAEHPEAQKPETTLPKDAFEFEENEQNTKQ